MLSTEMPRRRRTFKLDERILEALASAAKRDNASANNWLESLLLKVLKAEGILEKDFEPLGETRGGDRTSSQNPPPTNNKKKSAPSRKLINP